MQSYSQLLLARRGVSRTLQDWDHVWNHAADLVCLPHVPCLRSFSLRLRSEAHRWKTTCQSLGQQPRGMMICYQTPFPCWIPGLSWEKQWDLLVSLACSSPNCRPYTHDSCRVAKKEALSVCCIIGNCRGEGMEGNTGNSFPLLCKGES